MRAHFKLQRDLRLPVVLRKIIESLPHERMGEAALDKMICNIETVALEALCNNTKHSEGNIEKVAIVTKVTDNFFYLGIMSQLQKMNSHEITIAIENAKKCLKGEAECQFFADESGLGYVLILALADEVIFDAGRGALIFGFDLNHPKDPRVSIGIPVQKVDQRFEPKNRLVFA